jgi:hypothetical protein
LTAGRGAAGVSRSSAARVEDPVEGVAGSGLGGILRRTRLTARPLVSGGAAVGARYNAADEAEAEAGDEAEVEVAETDPSVMGSVMRVHLLVNRPPQCGRCGRSRQTSENARPFPGVSIVIGKPMRLRRGSSVEKPKRFRLPLDGFARHEMRLISRSFLTRRL